MAHWSGVEWRLAPALGWRLKSVEGSDPVRRVGLAGRAVRERAVD